VADVVTMFALPCPASEARRRAVIQDRRAHSADGHGDIGGVAVAARVKRAIVDTGGGKLLPYGRGSATVALQMARRSRRNG